MIFIRHRESGALLFQDEGDTLAGLDLSGARLEGADLRHADLRGARLAGARLHGADLRFALGYGARLEGADLSKADLRFARFDDPALSLDSGLVRTSLRRVNLARADLRFTLLGGVDGREACFTRTDLREAILDGAWLQEAELTEARLRQASLRATDLRATRMFGTDVREARLDGARLEGTDLRFADLREARLERASYDGATRWHPTVSPRARGALRLLTPSSGEEDGALPLIEITFDEAIRPDRRVLAPLDAEPMEKVDPCQRARADHREAAGCRPALKHIRRCAACRRVLEVEPLLASDGE